MVRRRFPETERRELAHEGHALEDGSYPLPDCDAVQRAIEAYGREDPERRPALRRLIVKRHLELGCKEALPESWRLTHGR